MSVPRIVLPDCFKAVTGDTLQLFFRGIIEHPFPYVYNIEAICDIGKNTSRYFEVTPSAEQIGEHVFTINLRDFDDRIIATASTIIKVCAEHKSPSLNKNILCVGDSLTAGGVWPAELSRRLTELGGSPEGKGLDNIRFIGTCKKGTVGYEGYGGWTWGSYLVGPTEQRCEMWAYCTHNKDEGDQHSLWKDCNGGVWKIETICPSRIKLIRQEPFKELPPSSNILIHVSNADHVNDIEYTAFEKVSNNPFWNTNSLSVDFKSYCKQNGFDDIDLMCTLLTWNGGGGFLEEKGTKNIETQVADAKSFLRIFHSQYPKAKVMLMGIQLPSLNGGCGASYGASREGIGVYSNTYALCRYVFQMNIAYQALANEDEFASYVDFVNVSAQFDSENNMPETDKLVNLRSTKTEKVGTNGVHPTIEGYYQIADAVYRSIDF